MAIELVHSRLIKIEVESWIKWDWVIVLSNPYKTSWHLKNWTVQQIKWFTFNQGPERGDCIAHCCLLEHSARHKCVHYKLTACSLNKKYGLLFLCVLSRPHSLKLNSNGTPLSGLILGTISVKKNGPKGIFYEV